MLPVSNAAYVRTKENAWETHRDAKIPVFDDFLADDSFFFFFPKMQSDALEEGANFCAVDSFLK